MAKHKKEATLLLLVKVGSHANMSALIDCGTIYINHWNYFRRVEPRSSRRDEWEGYTRILQPNAIRGITITRDNCPAIELSPAGPVKMYIPDHDRFRASHVYCMTGVSTRDAQWRRRIIHPRMAEFGDTAVVIHDTVEFLTRFRSAVETYGFPPAHMVATGCVHYVPEKYSGDYSAFHKRQSHDWQREFRILVAAGSKFSEPLSIGIGSLRDVAHLVTVSEMKNEIRRVGGAVQFVVN